MNKFLFKPLLILPFVIFLSGCVFGLGNNSPASNGPEVIQARDCGQEGLQCCNEDPSCSYGMQCCVDPNNPSNNQCANSCNCGGEDAFCCKDGPKCQDGFSCYQAICKKCGGENQPCCGENSCQENLGCLSGKCVLCGSNKNPCCPGNKCANQNLIDENRAECMDGICRPCGSYGNISCAGDLKCLKGNLFNNNLCYKCGSQNQPCCDKAAGLGYDCDLAKGLSCIVGFCNK